MNIRQQNYYDDLLQIAKKRNGKVITERYDSMPGKMSFQCENNHIWNTQARSVLKGTWCKHCAGKSFQSGLERFTKKVAEKEGTIIGNYTGADNHVLLRCKFGHDYNTTPTNIYKGSWCPSCTCKNYGLGPGLFLKTVEKRRGKVIGNYINGETKIAIQCEKGHIWETKPRTIVDGKWCSHCRESKGEAATKSYLLENNIKFEQQGVIESLPRRRFDFIIQYKNENIVIEFDGNQHFEMVLLFHKTEEEFQRRQAVDKVKTALALYSGYKVIRIDYSQLNNIEFHLNRALTRLDPLYVSTHKLYDKWMLNTIIPYEQYLQLR